MSRLFNLIGPIGLIGLILYPQGVRSLRVSPIGLMSLLSGFGFGLVEGRRSSLLLHLAGSLLYLLGDLAVTLAYAGILVEANSEDREQNDDSDECPGSLLEEVSRFRSTHNLVATSKTCGQTAAFRVLYQHQQHHEDAGQYDENSQK